MRIDWWTARGRLALRSRSHRWLHTAGFVQERSCQLLPRQAAASDHFCRAAERVVLQGLASWQRRPDFFRTGRISIKPGKSYCIFYSIE